MKSAASYLRFDHLLVGKHPLVAPNTKLQLHRHRTRIAGWGGSGRSTLARLLTAPAMPDFVLRQERRNISIPESIQQWTLFAGKMLEDPFPPDMLRFLDAPDYAERFRTQLAIEMGLLEELCLGSVDREEVTASILRESPMQELRRLSLSRLVLAVIVVHLIARRLWSARLPVVIDDLGDLLPQPLYETTMRYLTRHHQVSQLVSFEYPRSTSTYHPDFLLRFYEDRIHVFRNRS